MISVQWSVGAYACHGVFLTAGSPAQNSKSGEISEDWEALSKAGQDAGCTLITDH